MKENQRDINTVYYSIGGDRAVCGADVVGIFDIDNTTTSKHTVEFLNGAQERGEVVLLAPDIPVSFVVTTGRDGAERVFLSQYAPRTLVQRRLF